MDAFNSDWLNFLKRQFDWLIAPPGKRRFESPSELLIVYSLFGLNTKYRVDLSTVVFMRQP